MIEAQPAGAALGTLRSAGPEGEASALLPGNASTPRKRWVCAVVGLMMACAVVAAVVTPSPALVAPQDFAQTAPMNSSSTAAEDGAAPPCSLSLCSSSGCDWKGAPFLCVGGGSTGGCATDVFTWASKNGGCTSFCDLSDCEDTIEKADSGAEGTEDR